MLPHLELNPCLAGRKRASDQPSGRVAASSQALGRRIDQRRERLAHARVIGVEPGDLRAGEQIALRSAGGRSAPASASRTH